VRDLELTTRSQGAEPAKLEVCRCVVAWPEARLAPLVEESIAEGFGQLLRLRDEWRSGANRFEEPGEGLWIAECGERVVAVCGLNRDPFAHDPGIARLRRLYVTRSERGRGLGRRLVSGILRHAARDFGEVRLRAGHSSSEGFFHALGFERAGSLPEATHRMRLGDG
jgi:N-acetylglutamate synthase-like GNAT family acetyltransferase